VILRNKSVFRVFQKIRHCTLSWASSIRPPISIPLRLNFPRGLPDQTSARGPIFHIRAMRLLRISFFIQLSYQQNVIAPTVKSRNYVITAQISQSSFTSPNNVKTFSSVHSQATPFPQSDSVPHSNSNTFNIIIIIYIYIYMYLDFPNKKRRAGKNFRNSVYILISPRNVPTFVTPLLQTHAL
jgi:hypothetical protein